MRNYFRKGLILVDRKHTFSKQSRADVIIVGCGGHAKVIADIVLHSGDRLRGFLVADNAMDTYLGIPILGTDSCYEKYLDCRFIIGIGDAEIRERLTRFMDKATWYTAIHPSAIVSDLDTNIADGTVVAANAVINPGAVIGKHCIINTGAVIEHDDVIGDYVHVSVGSKLAGHVHVGSFSHVGIGSSVRENIQICDHCMIGAGAVVISNLQSPGVYYGVPCSKKM